LARQSGRGSVPVSREIGQDQLIDGSISIPNSLFSIILGGRSEILFSPARQSPLLTQFHGRNRQMISSGNESPIGLMFSGGIDSTALLNHLLTTGCRVVPIYVRSSLPNQAAEMLSVVRTLRSLTTPVLEGLVTLDLSLEDNNPRANTHHRMGRTAAGPMPQFSRDVRQMLLFLTAAQWCAKNGVVQLASGETKHPRELAAQRAFYRDVDLLLSGAAGVDVTIIRPFAQLQRRHVVSMGRRLHLTTSFSCSSPLGISHCGVCPKCQRRKEGFDQAGVFDTTTYVRKKAVAKAS
jgi:7-cyano-7-deazaguanine synthase in queuosine biosynthesis